ncbi:MAG: flagellin [Gemmobacter sp.]
MTTINTNISAITAQASMNQVEGDYQNAMTRLSTGLRVNSAADDAAGLAIGEKMTAQVMGLEQAVRNATDGQSLVNTAEGAQKEITSMLQRIRELAVQSSSDTNTALDRASVGSEAKQLISEINRIAETTTFNGMKLLDGSYAGKTFQIGADQGQTLNIDIDSAAATDIGAYTVKSNVTAADAATSDIAAGTDISITGYLGSATVTSTAGQSAANLAAEVNANTASTGVTASAETNVKLSDFSAASTVTFSLNDVSIGTVNISDETDLSSLAEAVNNVANQTGITAKLSDDKASITLTDAKGNDIKISDYDTGVDDTTLTVTALEVDGTAATTAAIDLTDTTAAITDATITGQVTFASAKDFSVGASDTTAGESFLETATQSADLESVAEVDLSTADGAAKAITVIDTALQAISASRSELGAISNRLESTISNLSSISTSVSAARSQIMDADYATESTNLARSQIISQAAQAMLAQANSNQKNVLQLIKG